MNYYGFTYKGQNASYVINKNSTTFDNPYNALKCANDLWNTNPDNQISRLLVIIKGKPCANTTHVLEYAFFQFTNSKACEQFISIEHEIVWSTNEKQVWNGNAHWMK